MSLTNTASSPASAGAAIFKRALILPLLIFLAGAALRVFAPPHAQTAGHDELLYAGYVDFFAHDSLLAYPAIVQHYATSGSTETRLPPTRFLYIFFSLCWKTASGQTALQSISAISCLFSILTMPLAAGFAFRLGGGRIATGVLALVACSPMQIYVSRHGLIDGFFAFWALLSIWLLWENLQKNRPHPALLAAYVASIALVVLTKENAFFVFVALIGILIANWWLKFGRVDALLVACTFAGALAGAAGIVLLSGGPGYAIETYAVLVRNASHLDYAFQTGDGPWYRYICELLLMSPFVLLLAVGAVFGFTRATRDQWFLFCFVAFSYAIMCNVRYGMNLRYTNMWDMPLRYLAFSQLSVLCGKFSKEGNLVLVLFVAALCAFDLSQYKIFFVDHGIYEPVPHAILRALHIFIPPP